MTQTPIVYSGFWDVPLGFVVEFKGYQIFFSRIFDDIVDDYASEYDLFVLPRLTISEIQQSWQELPNKARLYLGALPVTDVDFDFSKRQSIDVNVLERFTEAIESLR